MTEAFQGRVVRQVAHEAIGHQGAWIRNLHSTIEQFHWSDVAGNDWNGLSCAEVKSMLWSCAGRRIVETRAQEILANPKLDILQTILELGCRSRCSDVQSKSDRRMLMRLRGGTAPFEIEVGRWKGVPRENRICKQCQLSEIEDVYALAFKV